MDNRGKPWSIDDDQKIMETPHFPNTYFAQSMGRTENAIKCRRSHIAAKMHQNDPSVSLEEFVVLMNADYAQASELLMEWNQKRANMKSFIESKRKRAALSPPGGPALPHPAPASLANMMPAAASSGFRGQAGTDNHNEDERINFICKRICDEGGNLTPLWNVPQILPALVRHYDGFEAYARVIRVLAASSSSSS